MIINYPTGDIFYNVENPKGRRDAIPQSGGLYLVGNTAFNPITAEQFFMVKIGMSTNIYNRMRNYATSNPMMFHIDYRTVPARDYVMFPKYERTTAMKRDIEQYEARYHRAMEDKGFCHFEYCNEWYLVSKEVYMEICEKGFDYFGFTKLLFP